MTTFVQYLVNGIAAGGVYVLVGVGVTLVYGLTRLVNFAHGEQVTVGALIAFSVVSAGGGFVLGTVAGGLGAAAVGLAMERAAFRFTRPKPVNGIILSIGLTFIFQAVFFWIWGDEVESIPQPFSGTWEVGGVIIGHQRVLVTAVAGLLVTALFGFLKRTKSGRAIRAFAQDPDAALLMGVNSELLVAIVFVIGGLLAGCAGAFLLSLVPVDRFVGATFAVKGFMVAIVGGLGTPIGALYAGLLIGLAESLAGGYIGGGYSMVAGLLAAIAILMVRPQGITRGQAGVHL